jgi:hypothetical protein
VNSKYDKYSTEQLEVIYTHLTDPAEKELVKKELSARYYQHYLNVGTSGADQAPAADLPAPPGQGTAGAAADTDQPAPGDGVEAGEVEDEDLSALGAVAPITLTPVSSEAAANPGTSSSEKPDKKKYCFIATAAYGSPLAREVVLLQNYRDKYLATTHLGEKFIRAYYRFSPRFAYRISRNNILKLLTRFFLTPLILLIKRTTSGLSRS